MKKALEIFKKENEARIENYNEGFGPIDWVDLETALRLNKDNTDNRPIFLFAHKSTCEQCKSSLNFYKSKKLEIYCIL